MIQMMGDVLTARDAQPGDPPEAHEALLRTGDRWAHAAELARMRPDLDIGDIYHSLRCMDLTPTERLARGLNRVRAQPRTP
jgi:hypothetical protein